MKKDTLKNWFSAGKKPTGEQFSALIDSFIHKDEKIEASQVNGISELTRDFNAEQSRQSQQLNALAEKYNTHQASIDGLETAVTENTGKQVAGLTITGDVNKLATITFADGSVLQAFFTDIDTQNTADVMLNSLNFDISTGILTGVRSDGQRITVDLDGRFAPISHTHGINDVLGLSTELSNKALLNHAHNMAEVSGLLDAINSKANIAHNHSVSDINSLQSILDSKSNNGHGHTISQITNLQNELNNKADLSHTHTIADITNLQKELNNKADLSHTHTVADITNLQKELNSKANTSHTHNASEIVGLTTIGRNYVINSMVAKHNNSGFITYPLSDDMEDGIYTVQLWYETATFNGAGIGVGNVHSYNGRHLHLFNLEPTLGKHTATFQINKGSNTHLTIYVNASTTIKKIKVERGSTATEWCPAYEDSFFAEQTRSIFTGSEQRVNQSWFDYNMMETGNSGVMASFSGIEGDYRLEIGGVHHKTDGPFYIRTRNGDNNTWNKAQELIHSGNIQWYIDNVVKKQSVLNDNTIPIKIENLGKTLIASYNGDVTIDLSAIRDGSFKLLKTTRGLVNFTGARTPNGTLSISLTEANILDVVVHKGISYITTKPIISK